MRYPYEKAMKAGAGEVWLTERGNMYGYNNLVVDFRNIPDMLGIASTVVMDCTHSVQRPGAAGGKTGGNREFVPAMGPARGYRPACLRSYYSKDFITFSKSFR